MTENSTQGEDLNKDAFLNEENDEGVSSAALESEIVESEVQVDQAFATLRQDLDAAQDKYARLGAEFENYKKRSEREQQRSIAFANERILVELLPVLDHFDSAVSAASKWLSASGDGEAGNRVLEGLNMVQKQFTDVMSKFGIKAAASAKGQQFDPHLHEAVAQQESAESEEGVVLEEYQKGYTLHERLVRPARVVVAKKKSENL